MVKRWICLVIIVLAAAVVVPGASAAPGGTGAVDGYIPELADMAADAMAKAFGISHAEALDRLRSQERRIALGERLVGQHGGRLVSGWISNTMRSS